MSHVAYVGSRTTRERRARGHGLYVYRVSEDLGDWRLVQVVEAMNPSFLCASSASRRLFAVHGDGNEVSAFAIDSDGALAAIGRQTTGGRNPVHLELTSEGRRLVVANYATGSVAGLNVTGEGALEAIGDVLELVGEPGPHRIEQAASHPHQVHRWPGSDLFVVPNKGLDKVHVVRAAAGRALELASELEVRSGAGPRHCAFDTANDRLWVCNELDSTVTTCRFDAAQGRLAATHVATLLRPDFTGENRAAGIVADPGRRTVYVSNRGMDCVTVLRIDDATGSLTPIQFASSFGRTPRFLTLAPDACSLLVANEGSDSIVRFAVAADGSLEDGRVVAQPGSPVCIVLVDTDRLSGDTP